MTIKDYGSTIMFFGDCIKYAELHFTGDFGHVLVVYPAALARGNKRWNGIDSVRTEFKPDFEKIFAKYRVDRISMAR